ncbi:MAG: dephospho-CoA kinase [Sulfuricurvum sp. PC08-66]|nr:MAG: dephospho-CoA kinase [Sulfuricurvum sp. PC08-66]
MHTYRYAIALTGSIATGKSSAISLLKLHGLQSIDADAVAHALLRSDATAIDALFEENFLDANGAILRTRLGEYIFGNPAAKAKLEAYMHPKIRDAIYEQSRRFEALKFPYLIEIPLFFETRSYPIERSVVVYAPREVQFERLMQRNNFTYEQAKARIDAQMDIETKKSLATYVIDNSGNLKQLQRECEAFVDKIKNSTF